MEAHTLNTYEGESAEPAEHVMNMLEKADALEEPAVSDRPEWLPEKFQSPEDMARAYSELEKKLGSRQPENDLDEGEETVEDVIEEDDGSPQDTLDLEKYSQEFFENGDLSEESINELVEQLNLPRDYIDTYLAGLNALQTQTEQQAYQLVGGQQEYQRMTQWASANLPEPQVDAFNRAINSGDSNLIQMAIQGLNAQYRSEVGSEPRLISGESAGVTSGGFASVAQLTEAMRDPRYAKDPAYREDIARKLARSSIL